MVPATDLPRITYADPGSGIEAAHRAFDAGLPAFRAERLGRSHANWIAGRPDEEGVPYTVASPLDGDLGLGSFVAAGDPAVGRAVAAARAAFAVWGRMGWRDRVAAMRRVADVLDGQRLTLAMASLYEVGKNRIEALGEAEEAVALVRYYCDQMEKNAGYVEPSSSGAAGESSTTLLRPVGVFAVIAPFNYPVALTLNMVGAALVAGNTVVLKPTPGAGLTASLLAAAFAEADLPPGTLNIVCGETAGPALVAAPGVDGFAFTGSYEVGTRILRHAAAGPHMRPVLAEMGGKNAAYVSRSADPRVAAEGIARSAFNFQGQKCTACSVAFVHEDLFDGVLDILVERAGAVRIGNTEERAVTNGPLINAASLDRYLRAVEQAGARGRIVTGGNRLGGGLYDRGCYVEPTIVAGLPEDDELFRRELFAPVLAVTPFRDLEEAIARGNRTPYGLAAGFYGRDRADMDRFLDTVEAGVLYVNRRYGATTGAWPGVQSFCGWKGSGLTGKGGLGPHYLPQFLREQSRTIRED